jgi:hypothetical protein
MVIRVPIAGWENSKRSRGVAGGAERQAERNRRAERSGKIRKPKTEDRRKTEGGKAEVAIDNIQHPTSNIQHPIIASSAGTGC